MRNIEEEELVEVSGGNPWLIGIAINLISSAIFEGAKYLLDKDKKKDGQEYYSH